MKIEPDRWLTEIFGCDVYKVSQPDRSEQDKAGQAGENLPGLVQKETAFLYAKVSVNCVAQVRSLLDLGFYVVDTNLTFERTPPATTEGLLSLEESVKEASLAEYKMILDIAASCFVCSRFHLDPAIPADLANEIKRAWVNSYIQGRRGERLWMAEAEGRPVGFLAELCLAEASDTTRVIDLIGVDAAYQGRGAGRKLVNSFIANATGRCTRLRVGTQAANIPSVRLYESCGFRLAHATYVLHAHIRKGKVM